MNLILEDSPQVPYFTDVATCLAALGVHAQDFDWFVSDLEANGSLPEAPLASRGAWWSGDALAQVLTPGLQVHWGVFSAFPVGQRPVITEPPWADGNPDFWTVPDMPVQAPGACFELVCWDSSATLLIGLSAEQAARFMRAYPAARALSPAQRE